MVPESTIETTAIEKNKRKKGLGMKEIIRKIAMSFILIGVFTMITAWGAFAQSNPSTGGSSGWKSLQMVGRQRPVATIA